MTGESISYSPTVEIFTNGHVCLLYIVISQGATVRVEFGDTTTSLDPTDSNTISRYFPHTYGQPLAHFLRATAKVPGAQVITEHPPVRYARLLQL